MGELLIALGSSLAYATGWFFTSRWLYGRWRAAGPTHRVTRNYRTHTEPWADGSLGLGAMVFSLAWPLVILTAAVRARPPKTPDEIASEARKLADSTAELRKANDDWEREIERSRRGESG